MLSLGLVFFVVSSLITEYAQYVLVAFFMGILTKRTARVIYISFVILRIGIGIRRFLVRGVTIVTVESLLPVMEGIAKANYTIPLSIIDKLPTTPATTGTIIGIVLLIALVLGGGTIILLGILILIKNILQFVMIALGLIFMFYIYPMINPTTVTTLEELMLLSEVQYERFVFLVLDSMRYFTVLWEIFAALVLPITILKILKIFNLYGKIPRITGYSPKQIIKFINFNSYIYDRGD
jgi:hypothetical protein